MARVFLGEHRASTGRLKEKLVADGFSPIPYEFQKSKELLDEDKVIGALKLGIRQEAVTITPVQDVFAR